MQEVRSFQGLASYYQRFVEGFSRLLSPLTTLTRKNVKLGSFEELKRWLTTNLVLTLYMPHKPFVEFSDTSKYSLSCVLM